MQGIWRDIGESTPPDGVPVMVVYQALWQDPSGATLGQTVAMIDPAWRDYVEFGSKADRLDFWSVCYNGAAMHPWDDKVIAWHPIERLPDGTEWRPFASDTP